MTVKTKEVQITGNLIERLLNHVKGLKYQAGKNVFTFERRQYKVLSVVEVGDETEVNFQAVSKEVVKKFTSVSFKSGKPFYDGFNDRTWKFDLEKTTEEPKKVVRTRKTPEEIKAHEKQYQKEYYERVTKEKRRKYREENPIQPKEYDLVCSMCGKHFPSPTPQNKYCSIECRKKSVYEHNKQSVERRKNTEAFKEARKRSYENRKKRLATDAEYRQRFKEQQAKSYLKRKNKNS